MSLRPSVNGLLNILDLIQKSDALGVAGDFETEKVMESRLPLATILLSTSILTSSGQMHCVMLMKIPTASDPLYRSVAPSF
jgi:hypothetical protein